MCFHNVPMDTFAKQHGHISNLHCQLKLTKLDWRSFRAGRREGRHGTSMFFSPTPSYTVDDPVDFQS